MLNLSQWKKVLDSLDEVLKLEKNPIIRDSAIQRFEYSFEFTIKLIKDI